MFANLSHDRLRRRASRVAVATMFLLALSASTVSADVFKVLNRDDEEVAIEARLAGSGREVHALEMADGQWLIVPQAAVKQRIPGDDPKPIEPAAMATRLEKMFRKERILTKVDKQVVVGLVLAGPLDPEDREAAVRRSNQLRKAGEFMRMVQGTFLQFIRVTRVPIQPVSFPLVALIFEADRDFETYATIVTGNRGLQAGSIAGFYDALSNQLVLRSSECDTFETPLHEAIHQQVYNRGIFQRLAPVPTWFNEGLATGFEGNGERIQGGPMQVSDRYAKLALRAKVVDWNEIVRDDRAFQGDVFAGEAYGQAWGLHWLLVNRHKTNYVKYVRLLAAKEPLTEQSADERLKEFEETIGTDVRTLQADFAKAILQAAGRKTSSRDRSDRSFVAERRSPPSPIGPPSLQAWSSPLARLRAFDTAGSSTSDSTSSMATNDDWSLLSEPLEVRVRRWSESTR